MSDDRSESAAAPMPIRTPDQRVRVFVSSTLQEMAPERAVARQAIARLRLSPVLFELGARPHPPQDLYRAYLAQSDIFVVMLAICVSAPPAPVVTVTSCVIPWFG